MTKSATSKHVVDIPSMNLVTTNVLFFITRSECQDVSALMTFPERNKRTYHISTWWYWWEERVHRYSSKALGQSPQGQEKRIQAKSQLHSCRRGILWFRWFWDQHRHPKCTAECTQTWKSNFSQATSSYSLGQESQSRYDSTSWHRGWNKPTSTSQLCQTLPRVCSWRENSTMSGSHTKAICHSICIQR